MIGVLELECALITKLVSHGLTSYYERTCLFLCQKQLFMHYFTGCLKVPGYIVNKA